MRPPRGLSETEAAAWEKLAATVTPLNPPRRGEGGHAKHGGGEGRTDPKPSVPRDAKPAVPVTSRPPASPKPQVPRPGSAAGPASRAGEDGLDSHWERRLRGGTLAPDFTLDLHEHSLDAAYQRLLGGLDLARETGARVVLVIAGRERPVDAADRGERRGAIRAKLLDWLAASRHASAIAAIRKAHRRHGGDGALYVILRKPR